MTLFELVFPFAMSGLAYALGRCRGRLLHMDEVCEAEALGFELGVQRGVELSAMSLRLPPRAREQRRGIVRGLN